MRGHPSWGSAQAKPGSQVPLITTSGLSEFSPKSHDLASCLMSLSISWTLSEGCALSCPWLLSAVDSDIENS